MNKPATTIHDDVKNHLAMMEADNDGLGDDDEPIAAESPIITEDELDDALENNFHDTLNKAREDFEAEQAEPVNPDDHFESPPVQDVKDIYSLEATEFMEMYKKLPIDLKIHFREEYRRILNAREKLNGEMAALKAEVEEKSIDFGMFKAAYKSVNSPGKKQKMGEASYAFFCKEWGVNQLELWERD